MRSSTQSCFDLNGLQAFKYGLNSKTEPETDVFLVCGTFKKGLQLVSVVAALAKPEKGRYGDLDSKQGTWSTGSARKNRSTMTQLNRTAHTLFPARKKEITLWQTPGLSKHFDRQQGWETSQKSFAMLNPIGLKKKIQMKPPDHQCVTYTDKASVLHHHNFIRAFEATHL